MNIYSISFQFLTFVIWLSKIYPVQNRLMVFERRVLRKIYGPTLNNDGTWRIKTNEELEILI